MSKEEALELLKEAEKMNPGRWIEHSRKVGQAAGRIAKKMGLDEEKASIMGYIHDIGKRYGAEVQHGLKGYEFLIEEGYSEEYADICLIHSYLKNDINCTGGGYPNPNGHKYNFRKKFIENHKYTIYEKIINFCDLMCTTKFTTLEGRLIDIYLRRNVYDNTVYHIKEAYKLKNELEEKMNCSIYSLFPEIAESLNK